MSIIGWLVLGLIAGFIASKIVNAQGQGVLLDIVLGIVGALVGGFIFNAVGAVCVTGFNAWSLEHTLSWPFENCRQRGRH